MIYTKNKIDLALAQNPLSRGNDTCGLTASLLAWQKVSLGSNLRRREILSEFCETDEA